MSIIVVNAIALVYSGGLTILRQFIEAIPDDDFEYIVFVSSKAEVDCSQPNVRIVPVKNIKAFYRRLFWDVFGVKMWLKKQHIKPYASLSLQNTNFRTGYKIPNYVYYHQSMPFFRKKWSPFKREEKTLWFYKNVYPFFVRLFLNNRTQVFVQLEFIKKGFADFFNFPTHRIHVITPNLNVEVKAGIITEVPTGCINLFYPAATHCYKNHSLIINALDKVSHGDAFTLYLTCSANELPIRSNTPVKYMGVLSRDEVWRMYQESDALVFPSYIETYGLPLLEAASIGLPILAADLPYAREVLYGYEGVTFVDYTDAQEWAMKIESLTKGQRYKAFKPVQESSWMKLFQIIK